MNPEDPLTRLRQQLVDAAHERARPATAPRRWRRPALWISLAGLIAVPAGATAAGLISLTSTGTTPSGSTYTISTLTDDQASYDPAVRDGIGRSCNTIRVLEKDGKLKLAGKSCRPKGYRTNTPIEAGHDQLGRNELLLTGSTTPDAATVEVLGRTETAELKPPRDQRRFFTAQVPLGKYTVIARDANGRELGRAQAGY